MSDQEYDAIIIGGGHNGLVCANILAKKNKKVIIVEARSACGGLLDDQIVNCVPNFSNEVISALGGLSVKYKPKNTIALSETGQHIRLTGNHHIDHKSIAMFSVSDADKYVEFHNKMALFSKTLGSFMMSSPPRVMHHNYSDYFKLFKLGMNVRFLGKKNFNEFARMIGLNIADELEDNFENTLLQGLIAHDSIIGSNLGPRSPGTVINLMYRMANHNNSIFGGNYVIEGGCHQLADALVNLSEKNNVKIITSSKVNKCIIQDDRAVGVELENGEQIFGKSVVSNADPKSTYFNLLGTENLDTDVKRRVQHYRSKGRVAKLILDLNSIPKFNNCDESDLENRMVIAPSIDYIEENYNKSKFDKLSDEPILEMSFQEDPSGNKRLNVQVQYASYKVQNGWEASKDQYINSVIQLIKKYSPEIEKSIDNKKFISPDDVENEYHLSGGHWHHGEIQIDQLFMLRPIPGASQYKTHLDGLYLCGAGSHPGGGLSGIPGKNAAFEILKERI